MALLRFRIASPAAGQFVGRSVTASGTARDENDSLPRNSVRRVTVQFGAGTSELTAQLANGNWTCTGSIPSSVRGGAAVVVTAAASGVTFSRLPNGEIGETPFGPVRQTVTVTLDGDLPDRLQVNWPPPAVTPDELPYVLNLTGSAHDAQTGIAEVELSVDDGPLVRVLDGGGNWNRWSARRTLAAGQHDLRVRATDEAGNFREASFTVSVRLRADPADAEQAFQTTSYLRELVRFVGRYVTVGTQPRPVTAADAAARFHQPVDRLVAPGSAAWALASTAQPRIAVEVLRSRLDAALPAGAEARFRQAAYEALLLALGSSFSELRLSNTAEQQVRVALAGRLGLDLEEQRPDRLDRITLRPAQLTDALLEELFGLRGTSVDPASPAAAEPTLLTWQLATARARWLRADEAERDGPEAYPILDPDLLRETWIRNRTRINPAYRLWVERTAWIKQTLLEIADVDGATQIARFNQLVRRFVGRIDVPALAARDAEGEDITLDLQPFQLPLPAFRALARIRGFAADGSASEQEWEDVAAILLQVQKRRQARPWRLEERRAGVVLEPDRFAGVEGIRPDDMPRIPRWRGSWDEVTRWLGTLATRTAEQEGIRTGYAAALAGAEAQSLPGLRDELIAALGRAADPPEDLRTAAERLSRELAIDLQAAGDTRTNRAEQAAATLQSALVAARAGRLPAAGTPWRLVTDSARQADFDLEWTWMGSQATWLAALRVFAYPENQLLPALFTPEPGHLDPTDAFRTLVEDLRERARISPRQATARAASYLTRVRQERWEPELDSPIPFALRPDRSAIELAALRGLSRRVVLDAVGNRPVPEAIPSLLWEVFWLVPMALAGKLQQSGHYQAALDWYRTVYAWYLPASQRRIFHGFALEQRPSTFDRVPEWLIRQLNPHVIARSRWNAYTRYTVMAIVGCFLDAGDADLARATPEAAALARTRYEIAVDLLDLPDPVPVGEPPAQFPANQVAESLREHAMAQLRKIHEGLDIAGAVVEPDSTVLPSQYRFAVLMERAKSLTSIAQQIEASYLDALVRRDDQAYTALQAGHDLRVAGAALTVQDLKVTGAETGIVLATLQRDRAQLQHDTFDQWLDDGLNGYETMGLAAMGAAAILHGLSGLASSFSFWNVGKSMSDALSAFASAASVLGQIAQTQASYERREQEWQLQRALASKDVEIGAQQVTAALNQRDIALQERHIAGLQHENAVATADFLATKFTNAELFEWMSGVLGRVYAYFLQQATAAARLAQAQLAFERQELTAGLIETDYWQDAASEGVSGSDGPDRRGLTGSARLLQDLFRLDQHAFDTDRRKLRLTQTLSMAQLAAAELQRFRETGVLTVGTPLSWFDREFPGHYLRLVKRVKVSVIAVVPAVYGVRGTLSAAGVSRVVAARGPFETVTLHREPESISFTAPVNATGLFELEPDDGLLLPFEGMGVETVWRLELPRAANPFDYRTIADVLLTVEYTALDSHPYRQKLVRVLDRSFTADRSLSIRDQFPDVWYELNNPDTVEDPTRRMRVVLPLTEADFPPQVQDLTAAQLTLFAVRAETLADELTVRAALHRAGGTTTEAIGPVRTVGGVVGSRRPGGAPWQPLLGRHPAGRWELALEDTPTVRSWFADQQIQDLVLVITLAGTTPAWTP